MSFSDNFPTISPSLLLDFANTEALDPRITFTRTTTATYYGTETAKAEENLLLRSQDFTTSWTAGGGVVVTPNTEVAPDGTTTADTITATAATSIHLAGQTVVGSSLPRVMSVFAKKGTNDYIQLCLAGDGAPFANFDLDLGVVGTKGASVTSSITSVGNGWYRCTMEYTSSSGVSFDVSLADSASMVRRAQWTALGTETVYLWGAQLEQRSAVSAYTPTTTQPITNYIPALQTAASGVARFDHNPTTGESLGLLVEEQRTNLITYSDDLANAAWTKTRSSITSNTIVAPDGTLTGDKLVENTDNNTHPVTSAGVTLAANTQSTASVFVKAGERSFVILRITADGTNYVACGFNLSTGTVGTPANAGNGSGASGSIVNVGNGWYRCSLTGIFSSTATNPQLNIYPAIGTTLDSSGWSYTGDGYSGIFLWGAQLEAGAFPTSYIATTSASVTRNADAASMTGTNFSSWYRADEGTLYVDTQASPNANTVYASINSGTINQNSTSFDNAGGDIRNVVYSNSSAVAVINLSTVGTVGVFNKLVAAYKVNDFAAVRNGGSVGTDTSGTVPLYASQFDIGRNANTIASTYVSGHIRKIAYYPSRIPDAQLQALTL